MRPTPERFGSGLPFGAGTSPAMSSCTVGCCQCPQAKTQGVGCIPGSRSGSRPPPALMCPKLLLSAFTWLVSATPVVQMCPSEP